MRKKWDLICFDLDGTLIRTKGMHDRAFTAALRAIDPSAAAAYEDMIVTRPMEELSTRRKLNALGKGDLFPFVKAHKDQHFLADLGSIEFRPDLDELMRKAEEKAAAVCIVTNCTDDVARQILKQVGLGDSYWLGDRLIAPLNETWATKPDPMLYNFAQQLWGAHEDYTLAFEDSPSGYAAAKAAGCHAVQITYEEMMGRLERCEF